MSFRSVLLKARSRWYYFKDKDAEDYAYRVERADGQKLPNHVCQAIDNFVITCKNTPSPVVGVSNWDAMISCAFLSGARTLAGMLVPLKGPAITNTNFVSGDYNPVTGLKGNGTNKWLRVPDYNLITIPTDNMHLATFTTSNYSAIKDNASFIAHGYTGGGISRIVIQSGDPRITHIHVGNQNTPVIADLDSEDFTGFVSAQRRPDDPGVTQYLFGGQELKTEALGTSVATFTDVLTVFNRRLSFAVDPSDARLSFFSGGYSVDLVALRTAVNHYMDEIAGVHLAFDPDAWDYIKRVETADKQKLSPEIREAMNDFVVQCKRDVSPDGGRSNWDALANCGFLAGPKTLDGALVPLKGSSPTNNNFVSGDYNAALGLISNGSNKNLTFAEVNSDVYRQAFHHLSVYITTPYSYDPTSNRTVIGYEAFGAYRLSRINTKRASDGGIDFRIYNAHGTEPTFGVPDDPDFTGFIGATRGVSFAANELKYLIGDEEVVSQTSSSAGPISSNQKLAVFHSNGNAGSHTKHRIAFYSGGYAVDLAALRNAINAYMKKLELLQQAYTDTEAYETLIISQGGAISEEEFNNIHEFAKGLYLLAGEPVDFFTFRSTQNVGTGSTAYSFHGRSASLVNGPVWSNQGLQLSGTGWANGEYWNGFSDHCTMFSVVKLAAGITYSSRHTIIGGDTSTQPSLELFNHRYKLIRAGHFLYQYGSTTPLDQFHSIGYSRIGGVDLEYNILSVNGVADTIADGGYADSVNWVQTSNSSPMLFGSRTLAGSQITNGDLAFVLVIADASISGFSQLHSLYKSTIGKGLGLP